MNATTIRKPRKIETEVRWVAFNFITGLYFDGNSFAAKERRNARVIEPYAVPLFRATWANAVLERL